MEERKNVYLSLHKSFVREGIEYTGRAVKDTVKVMPAQLKEAVDAGRSRYLAERAEHARQASRAAEHEAPRAQRSVER